MTELSQTLEPDLLVEAYLVATVLFVLAAVGAVAFVTRQIIRRRAQAGKSRLPTLTAGALIVIATLVSGFKFIGASNGDVVTRIVTISLADLMQKVDTNSLPVEVVIEPY